MIRVTATRHRALGRMIRLEAGPLPPLLFTPQEAATIARALDAVRSGRSAEPQIYLSPIGDDGEFLAVAEDGGMRLGPLLLDWPRIEAMAARLAAMAAEEA